MTTTPLTVLPVLSGRAGTTYASVENATTYNDREAFAYGHWLLGTDSTSLTGMEPQERVLTPQGTTPTFGTGYAIVDRAQGEALLTGVEDTGQSVTMWAVFRIPAGIANLIPVFGNLDNSPSNEGRSVYVTNGNELSFRVANSITSSNLTVSDDTWYFVAVSSGVDGGVILPGGYTANQALTNAGIPIAGANQFGFGNSNYEGVASADFHIAEAGIIRRACTAEDLHAIYTRSVARMAARSITVTDWAFV